jgi:hypothetical protein
MLYLDDEESPLSPTRARALLAQDPRVVRHLRAWVDDSELCLDVECRLTNGTMITVKMAYCWDSEEFRGLNYFHEIVEWLLNDDWPSFYEFVQKRFTEVLTEHATDPHYPQDED